MTSFDDFLCYIKDPPVNHHVCNGCCRFNFFLHKYLYFYSVETTIVSLMGPSDSEIKITTLDSEIKLPSSLFISGITLVIDRPFECEESETGKS